jgi:hypothetical protein
MRIGDSLFMATGKDGGPKSRVDGFWFIRIKGLFSVALLRFGEGTREAFHSHAFNSWSWLLTGGLEEQVCRRYDEGLVNYYWNRYKPSWRPIRTLRTTMHKVYGVKDSNWVLTFRGPWADTWEELDEAGDRVVLTHNRVEVSRAAS